MSTYLIKQTGDQPYYFEIVPRTIISRSQQKQQGQFRFHIYKTTQQVDFTKEALSANFDERRMGVKNVKLNFFLPNYIAGKNMNAKFIFQLSKKAKYSQEREVGQYTIDPNIYIEQYKRTQKNHFAQLWQLSDNYCVQVELFFQQSRYMLEKVLKQYRNSPANQFNKPLVSKALEKAKKVEVQQDQEYDNEERYKQKRLELLNKFSGSIIGQGGYRIFSQQEEKILQKKQSQQSKKSIQKDQSTSKISVNQKPSLSNQQQKTNKPKQQSSPEKPVIKRTDSLTVGKPLEEEFSQGQIKNIKYLIIAIVLLILAGSGYFVSKIFLKEEVPNKFVINNDIANDDSPSVDGKKAQGQKTKKPKVVSKGSKRTKKTQQL